MGYVEAVQTDRGDRTVITLSAPSVKTVADRYATAAKSVDAQFKLTMDEAGKYALQIMKQKAPDKTGTLRNSMTYTVQRSGTGYTVKFNATAKAQSDGAFYVNFVDLGTRPHWIRVKNKRALHFFDKTGTERYAQIVYHPGAKAANFSDAAAQAAVKRMPVLSANLLSRISKVVNG